MFLQVEIRVQMLSLCLGILCAGQSSGWSATAVMPGEEMRFADRAVAHYERGDLKGAISELRTAVKVYPRRAFYRFMLGNALYRAGKVREAAAEYEISLQLGATFEARMSAGFAHFELGEAVASAAHFAEAARSEPESAFARAASAVALYESGDVSNARIQYEHALQLDARYGNADFLSIDIRWKSRSREVLQRLNALSLENLD